MPTLVTVPPTTGPKSQLTGPELLLIELLVEAVCAARCALSCVTYGRNVMESRPNKKTAHANRTSRIRTPKKPFLFRDNGRKQTTSGAMTKSCEVQCKGCKAAEVTKAVGPTKRKAARAEQLI